MFGKYIIIIIKIIIVLHVVPHETLQKVSSLYSTEHTRTVCTLVLGSSGLVVRKWKGWGGSSMVGGGGLG